MIHRTSLLQSITEALVESVRFLIGGPRFGLSQRDRRVMIRQNRIGFPEHEHFGFANSTASTFHSERDLQRERDRSILQSPRSVSHPGGIPAISRGLSEQRATPPEIHPTRLAQPQSAMIHQRKNRHKAWLFAEARSTRTSPREGTVGRLVLRLIRICPQHVQSARPRWSRKNSLRASLSVPQTRRPADPPAQNAPRSGGSCSCFR